MACIDVESGKVNSRYYDIGYHILSPENERTSRFTTMFVHGVTRKDEYKNPHYKHIDDFLIDIVEAARSQKGIIEYKGGCFERDKLPSLGIPSFNIELFGCLRFDILYQRLGEQKPHSFDIIETLNCRRHHDLKL